MKDVAVISIEIHFSEKLEGYVKKLVESGQHINVKQLVDGLVTDYRRVMQNTPQFTGPLKELDSKVKIEISGKVL